MHHGIACDHAGDVGSSPARPALSPCRSRSRPVPAARVPHSYLSSGSYCVPSQGGSDAITKPPNGTCPWDGSRAGATARAAVDFRGAARDISERLFALNSLEVSRDARSRRLVLLQLCVVPVYPPPGGVCRMRVTGRVCKGASSAFACGVLAFATLGVGLESTSAQGVPAPCYLQLLTSADQNIVHRSALAILSNKFS
jgi:hypothetical protein